MRNMQLKINAGYNVLITETVQHSGIIDSHIVHSAAFVRGWPDKFNQKRIDDAQLFFKANELLAAAQDVIATGGGKQELETLADIVRQATTPSITLKSAIAGMNDTTRLLVRPKIATLAIQHDGASSDEQQSQNSMAESMRDLRQTVMTNMANIG